MLHPQPFPVPGLDVFPLHSKAWIHSGWTAAFTTFALVAAAPLPQLVTVPPGKHTKND